MSTNTVAPILTHILITPLMVTSFIGNIVTIIVKLHRKKLKTFNSGDLLIVNLAFCDINKTWAIYIIWIYTYTISQQWNFDKITCILLQKTVVILFSVTSITLLILTLERYYLIVKPFDRLFTLKRMRRILASIWLLTILLVSTPGFTAFDTPQINGVTKCIANEHRKVWMNVFEIAYFMIYIFIPLIAIFALSSKAANRLCKSMKTCCKHLKTSRKFNEKMRRNKSAINMLRSITAGGLLCYTPWAVAYLLQTQNRHALEKAIDGTLLQPFAAWLIFGGFCNAPMTYFIFSKEFRKEARRVFYRKRKNTATSSARISPY